MYTYINIYLLWKWCYFFIFLFSFFYNRFYFAFVFAYVLLLLVLRLVWHYIKRMHLQSMCVVSLALVSDLAIYMHTIGRCSVVGIMWIGLLLFFSLRLFLQKAYWEWVCDDFVLVLGSSLYIVFFPFLLYACFAFNSLFFVEILHLSVVALVTIALTAKKSKENT